MAHIQARQRAALEFRPLAVPPLVCYIPDEGTRFAPYPYPEASADPAKMMANELLVGFTSIYHAVDLHDDTPYCLRPNLGIGVIASVFGSQIRLVENNMPWAAPLGSLDRLRAVADAPLPAVRSGLGQRVLDQYAYYQEALRDYPRCRAAFQTTFPDLQGPFDTAELLWGSAVYADLFEEEELLRRLLGKISGQMLAVYRFLQPMVHEDLRPAYHWQHACLFKGRLLIRADSIVLMSPAMYRELVMPYDVRLAAELGGVGVHFCGNGQHQLANLLGIPGLQSLDLGQPDKYGHGLCCGSGRSRSACAGGRAGRTAHGDGGAGTLPGRRHSCLSGCQRGRRPGRLAAVHRRDERAGHACSAAGAITCDRLAVDEL